MSSGEQTIVFVFLQSIIIAVTTSLGRPYSGSICSIFPLCVESNAFEKSTNSSVALRLVARTHSTNCQILWGHRTISSLIFAKIFLGFVLDAIKKPGILIFRIYSSKSYASVLSSWFRGHLYNAEIWFITKLLIGIKMIFSMFIAFLEITRFVYCHLFTHIDHIYPTPPLGKDMTQGQFFKRSLTGLNSEFSFS